MKKGFLLLFLFTFFAANAQVTVTTTAGNLQTDMAGQTGVTHLIINGTLKATDFKWMKNEYSLETLDLSGVTAILEHNGPGGPENSVTFYAANEFPERGMYLEPTLTTIILPTNGAITSIGKYAFSSNTALTTFNIPASVTNIKDFAFNGCTSLVGTLTIPNTVQTLGPNVFTNTRYTTVVLPQALTTIPDSMVNDNPNLTTMEIPATVTSIGNGVFRNCPLITSVILPAGLQTIGGIQTFMNTGITSLVLPEGIQMLPNATGLVQMNAMYNGCTQLVSVNIPIPSNVTRLTTNVFRDTQLTHLVIPEGVNSLLANALANMPALTYLELPSTLTTINTNYSLGGLSALQTLKVHNPVPVVLASTPFGPNFVFDPVTLQVPTGTLAAYDAADIWTNFINIEEFGEAPALEVSTNTITAAAAGEDVTVTVTANVDWEAAANFNWVTISPASGSGDGQFVITVTPNTTGAERTALIEVFATAVESQIITVIQPAAAPAPSLVVSANSFNVAQAGESVTANITANVAWTATSNSEWLTVAPGSGTGDATLTLTATPNTTGAERTALVEVSANGVESQIITVTQSGTMGNDDFNALSIKVYPNPATDAVTVSGLSADALLEVLSINGSVMAKQAIGNNGTFSVAALPAGFYFARITSEGKTTVKKIVKQ
ncbi:leucine-rich repeat protein [uncultured Flavobacterium sp.]|uniref:leucine-rich repeat protein n=1 Tax=uncultured Flavobacterium sp. TaxID=165435 RepID=UPI0025F17DC1|nr:leucine-rich repeat protein [uncultured Flavobacterium sp.]